MEDLNENIDHQLKEIDRLIKECAEMTEKERNRGVPTPEQIHKFMTVLFMIQVYIVFIDPEYILINNFEKFLISINDETDQEDDNISIGSLD